MALGDELYLKLQRRLAEEGLTMEAEREDDLYAALTEGRDEVQQELSLSAPFAFQQIVTLEEVDADLRSYRFPEDAPDALRVLAVRDSNTLRELSPAAQLNQDGGDYAFLTPRTLRLSRSVRLVGDLEVLICPRTATPVEATTERADFGLPAACDRAVVLAAAVDLLTADEESDASVASRMLQKAMSRLENIYGGYDANDGMKLRHALFRSVGDVAGDMVD